MRFKRGLQVAILSLMLVGMMVFMSGCGLVRNLVPRLLNLVRGLAEEHLDNGDVIDQVLEQEEDEEEKTDQEGQEEPEIAVDDWRNPTELNEFIAMFERLEWSWKDVRDEGDAARQTAIYEYRGTEEIDGEDTTKVFIGVDDDDLILWLGEDEEVVQAEVNGDRVPSEIAAGQLVGTIQGAFWPFTIVDQLNPQDMFTDDEFGLEWTVLGTTDETIGQMQAEVTRVQVEIGPPLVDEDDEIKAEWGIGDFGDFQMLVYWDAKEGGEGQQWGVSIEVEEVIPR